MPKQAVPKGKILISGRAIRIRVRELGADISRYYAKRPPIVLGLMDGALFFLVDLLRELPPVCEVRCVPVKSYSGAASTGKISGLAGIGHDFKGRDVLIVDDVLDTGLTLAEVRKHLLALGAKHVDICVMLSKRKRRQQAVRARWVGFEIDDHFVIGYGLDYNGWYRSLKNVQIFSEQAH